MVAGLGVRDLTMTTWSLEPVTARPGICSVPETLIPLVVVFPFFMCRFVASISWFGEVAPEFQARRPKKCRTKDQVKFLWGTEKWWRAKLLSKVAGYYEGAGPAEQVPVGVRMLAR